MAARPEMRDAARRALMPEWRRQSAFHGVQEPAPNEIGYEAVERWLAEQGRTMRADHKPYVIGKVSVALALMSHRLKSPAELYDKLASSDTTQCVRDLRAAAMAGSDEGGRNC